MVSNEDRAIAVRCMAQTMYGAAYTSAANHRAELAIDALIDLGWRPPQQPKFQINGTITGTIVTADNIEGDINI